MIPAVQVSRSCRTFEFLDLTVSKISKISQDLSKISVWRAPWRKRGVCNVISIAVTTLASARNRDFVYFVGAVGYKMRPFMNDCLLRDSL
jgi:hypothetical protein